MIPVRSSGGTDNERKQRPSSLRSCVSVIPAADGVPSVCPGGQAARDKSLEAPLLVDDQEITRLLKEVSLVPGATLGPPYTESVNDLLMRAIRCAVKQYMLQAELRSLALTDELTGLYNRRGFLALAEQQLRLARRTERGVFLFFADLDGLKQINDSLGHLEGDLALIRTAGILKETFRGSDIIARFGGDEFTILAIEASNDSEPAIRNRLQEKLKKHNAKEPRCILSLSMGVARFDPHCPTSIGDLMAQADQAMYDDKRRSLQALASPLPRGCLSKAE
jgi:diguanylate cyclase (GGDEF)-like protein